MIRICRVGTRWVMLTSKKIEMVATFREAVELMDIELLERMARA